MPAKARFRSDRAIWEVIFRPAGKKPFRKAIGSGEEAEKLAHDTAAAYNEEENRAATFGTRRRGDPLPVDQVVLEWHAAHRETFSYGYEILSLGIIDNHLAPFFRGRDLRDLRERDALAFASHVVGEKGLSAAVAGHGLSILRRVSTLHSEHLDKNHFAGFGRMLAKIKKRRSKGARQPDAWSIEELRGILALARKHDPWLYPMIVFASHTGARQGETLGIRWSSIDFSRGIVTILQQLQHGEDAALKEGEKIVRVPMGAAGPLLRRTLEELAEKREIREPWREPSLVFQTPDGKPIDASNFRRAWRRFTERFTAAKIRPLRWHDFRHTFVTHALRTKNIKVVGQWVGHSATYMTEKYAHALPDDGADDTGFYDTQPAKGDGLRLAGTARGGADAESA